MFPNDIPQSSIKEPFRMILPSFVMLEWFPVSSHARKVLTPLTKYHRHQISEVSTFFTSIIPSVPKKKKHMVFHNHFGQTFFVVLSCVTKRWSVPHKRVVDTGPIIFPPKLCLSGHPKSSQELEVRWLKKTRLTHY